MPFKLTMAEARRRLAQLPDELQHGARPDVAIITDGDTPVLAILPWDFYDGLMETLELLDDSEQMALLHQGMQDMAAERTELWEAVKSNLPLR